ncbi:NUDIX hydrolase [Ornithinimicrobium tianjinense]|uniref:ADP-ribose pyrophosphatase n=1 Tax=Ornithinimicrobium tianjinense TaxID=1195761 RepID=A0A917BT92_9MICO|nr:NUDIX domain-containing protein [Ornithinimicrobium tianjinense]GGF56581.1 ADP-ribose pyrophosphatase [Ornithinimicrobium tianjinense]
MNRVSVRAAGTLPYRLVDGRPQVALVHRPKYDDWSWPKGKLDAGEDWAAAAARETCEETGLQVRLGMPLPEARYPVSRSGLKRVRYWAAEVVGGEGALEHEVDEICWLDPTEAWARLTYARDREQCDALVALHEQGTLATWPLLLVRHAVAVARQEWVGPDPERPLTEEGQTRSRALAGLLRAYAPHRVLSSPSVRCVDTLQPFVAATGTLMVTKKGLSEEGFERSPGKVVKHLGRLLTTADPAALCTHRPLFGTVLAELRSRAAPSLGTGDRRLLSRLGTVSPDKGEVLVCLMQGAGAQARVVAVERHRP